MNKTDFPLLTKQPDVVYLDSGATTLKPQRVIDAELDYYQNYSANIHRGLYPLSIKATHAYDAARASVANFLHSKSASDIVFTKGATDGLNLLASSLAHDLNAGDEIACTILEHHSNFVPWQQICQHKKMKLQIVDSKLTIQKNGQVKVDTYISKKTKILALPYVSNVTGEILPIKEIISAARKINPQIITIIDACQAVAHLPVDVQDLDCDFLVFSGHKLYGPTGIGVLYGKKEQLERLPPYQFGGDMIHSVSIAKTTYAQIPSKFEAGTPPIAQAIGLGAAIKYVHTVGFDAIQKHEADLYAYAIKEIAALGRDVSIVQPTVSTQNGHSIVTFTSSHVHAHDLADLLGQSNICVRAGHHCAQPLHDHLGLSATARISFGLYNTFKDVDAFVAELQKIIAQFK